MSLAFMLLVKQTVAQLKHHLAHMCADLAKLQNTAQTTLLLACLCISYDNMYS